MPVLTNYKGLQVVEEATADGGQALTSNFKWIADRVTNIQVSTPWNTVLGGDSTSVISTSSVTYGFVGPGKSNVISNGMRSDYSVIVSGSANRIGNDTAIVDCNYSLIGTGSNNVIATDSRGGASAGGGYHLIGAGEHNTIIGRDFSCILTGNYNFIKSLGFSTILFGSANCIWSLVGYDLVGGYENQIGTDTAAADMIHATILNGWKNRVYNSTLNEHDSFYETVINGQSNEIDGFNNYALIANGYLNKIANGPDSAACAVIVNGIGNRIGADTALISVNHAFIGNGTNNQIYNNSSGFEPAGVNYNNTSYATIINGKSNQIRGVTTYAFIGSGEYNSILDAGPHCVISGGNTNRIQGTLVGGNWYTANASAIISGYMNIIHGMTASVPSSIIGGGNHNQILQNQSTTDSHYSAIVGGLSNVINGSSQASFIGSGEYNVISNGTANAMRAVIVGGYANRIGSDTTNVNCNGSFIGTGINNLIITPHINIEGEGEPYTDEHDGYHLIGVGENNTIIGRQSSCIINGNNNFIKSGGGSTVLFGSWNNIWSVAGDNLVGGYENQIGTDTSVCDTTYAIILNGRGNRIVTSNIPSGGWNGMVLNGQFNDVIGFNNYATIVNGYINKITGFNNYAIIANGYMNVVSNGTDSAACAVIVNGVGNRIGADTALTSANYAFIGNGANNQIHNTQKNDGIQYNDADYATILNGMNNSIKGITTHSFIGSGRNNLIDAKCGHATYCVILNGLNNQLIGSDSSGWSGESSLDYAFIGGGYGNIIRYFSEESSVTSYSSICGGRENLISGHSSEGFIGGGEGNILKYASTSVVVGGLTNKIMGSHPDFETWYGPYSSFIGGGQVNYIGSSQARLGFTSIVGGYHNRVLQDQSLTDSPYSTIINGKDNTINGFSQSSFIGCGEYNTINPVASTSQRAVIVGGYYNRIGGSSIPADYAQILGGLYGVADHYGQFTQASGRFSTIGDAQTSILLARAQTTNATATELYLDGASLRLSLLDQDAHAFRIMVVGRGISGVNDEMAAAYELTGLIKRVGSTTSMVGSTKTVIAEDVDWDANVTAQNNYLEIKATGDSSTTVRWVARIELVEVNG